VLYAPGLRELADIRAVCDSVRKPVNVLALAGMSVADLFEAGAQRVSVGGGLAWNALGALVEAANVLLVGGTMPRPAAPLALEDWLAGEEGCRARIGGKRTKGLEAWNST